MIIEAVSSENARVKAELMQIAVTAVSVVVKPQPSPTSIDNAQSRQNQRPPTLPQSTLEASIWADVETEKNAEPPPKENGTRRSG
ncbi:MAG: hypothetical protein SGJ20_22565, partial [Planctomycetota bacterium]|nr:hypothetical protein [Planctomycetota bacterium]